ncbi:MAG TPA: hypothetical protein VMT61_18065 [Candidatus Binataceae bacterium]|nr:hypothetical protein [Candidatus Binataceae bacterium]
MSAERSEAAEARPTLPELLEVTRKADEVVLKLAIPRALLFFEGHFPHFPILPGVVQLHWVIHYSKELLLPDALYGTAIKVKFLKPIRPLQQLTLRLKYLVAKREVRFEYADKGGSCSSGRIGFVSE